MANFIKGKQNKVKQKNVEEIHRSSGRLYIIIFAHKNFSRLWLCNKNRFRTIPDPYFFGPPGSVSGSFYHQAKIVRKT
jgi:hypothetical protein